MTISPVSGRVRASGQVCRAASRPAPACLGRRCSPLGRKEAGLKEARSQGVPRVSEARQEVRIQDRRSMEVDLPSLQESLQTRILLALVYVNYVQGWFYDLASNLRQVESKILTRFGKKVNIVSSHKKAAFVRVKFNNMGDLL